MSETNSRFKQLAAGITTEMIAHQTQLMYDPTAQRIEAMFTGSPYLRVEDKYIPLGNEMDILRVDLTTRMIERPAKAGDLDPVTGADLSMISTAGVSIILKRAYDNYHNEREAERQAAIAAAQGGNSPPNETPDPEEGGTEPPVEGGSEEPPVEGGGEEPPVDEGGEEPPPEEGGGEEPPPEDPGNGG